MISLTKVAERLGLIEKVEHFQNIEVIHQDVMLLPQGGRHDGKMYRNLPIIVAGGSSGPIRIRGDARIAMVDENTDLVAVSAQMVASMKRSPDDSVKVSMARTEEHGGGAVDEASVDIHESNLHYAVTEVEPPPEDFTSEPSEPEFLNPEMVHDESEVAMAGETAQVEEIVRKVLRERSELQMQAFAGKAKRAVWIPVLWIGSVILALVGSAYFSSLWNRAPVEEQPAQKVSIAPVKEPELQALPRVTLPETTPVPPAASTAEAAQPAKVDSAPRISNDGKKPVPDNVYIPGVPRTSAVVEVPKAPATSPAVRDDDAKKPATNFSIDTAAQPEKPATNVAPARIADAPARDDRVISPVRQGAQERNPESSGQRSQSPTPPAPSIEPPARRERYGANGVITLTPSGIVVFDKAKGLQRMIKVGDGMPDGSILKVVDVRNSRVFTTQGEIIYE